MKALTNFRKLVAIGILKTLLIVAIICAPGIMFVFAQNSPILLHFKKSRTKKVNLRFEMINNLIIVPVFINGSDTLKFILDTGVSHTMITSLNGAPGISFNYAREIELFGLGSGREVKAYHSFGNVLEMPRYSGL